MRLSDVWLGCLVVAIGACAASCFNVNPAGIDFLCSVYDPRCPEGQTCIDSHCRTPLPDGRSAVDLATGDGGSTADMARSGCANNAGMQVGQAWACPGTFPVGNATKQCATGFSVCKVAAGIDLDACNKINGFFVADALGYSEFSACRNVDANFFSCVGYQPLFDHRLRFGCGGLNQPYVLTNCTLQCAGFDRALNCSREVDYTCGSSSGLADEANLLPSSGTLCCPG